MTSATLPALQARPVALSEASLLDRRRRRQGYTDCFGLAIPREVTLAQFIEAFYTTRLFKAERLVLRLLGRGATDRQAAELAAGRIDRFAIWNVVERTADEILLTDGLGRTSSWLMVVAEGSARQPATRLFFGTAVRARSMSADGRPRFDPLFHALLGLHGFYARRLLQAAAARLLDTRRRPPSRA